ncbi:MAG: diguanylate cyclase [Hylemonella sp.]|nr:diguanylate cyclase [Hylemonella sp.]
MPHSQPDNKAHEGDRPPRWYAMVAALYLAAAALSLGIVISDHTAAPLWFADAVGTAALLALPVRRWPVLLLLLALVNTLISTLAQAQGTPLAFGPVIFAVGSGANMLFAATLLRRLSVHRAMLQHPGLLGRVLVLGALLPSMVSSLAAATLLTQADSQTLLPTWLLWFAGTLIGNVAMLPLALTIWLQGREALRLIFRRGIFWSLLLNAAVTLTACYLLPQPFIIVVLPLVLLGARARFVVTAMATALTAALLGLLHAQDILTHPPQLHWWEEGLFYASFLACLLPGLFLAAAVAGRAQITRQLAASERRFRTLYTETPAMLQSVDANGRIIQVSRLWLKIMGYKATEVVGRPDTDFLAPESALRASQTVIPQAKLDGHCEDIEYQMITREGSAIDVLLSAVWTYDASGAPLQSLAVLQDVTEKKRLARRSHYAEHDPLTDLPNRVLLNDRLNRSILHHTRTNQRFAVCFLDLDHFKEINDDHGHEAGDLLLKEMAKRMQSTLRATDTVSRLAGDEFVLLLDEVIDQEAVLQVARKLLDRLIQPCRLGTAPDAPLVTVGASMGIAFFPDHGEDPTTLLACADQAMYAAKHQGRNRVEIYAEPDDPDATRNAPLTA